MSYVLGQLRFSLQVLECNSAQQLFGGGSHVFSEVFDLEP